MCPITSLLQVLWLSSSIIIGRPPNLRYSGSFKSQSQVATVVRMQAHSTTKIARIMCLEFRCSCVLCRDSEQQVFSPENLPKSGARGDNVFISHVTCKIQPHHSQTVNPTEDTRDFEHSIVVGWPRFRLQISANGSPQFFCVQIYYSGKSHCSIQRLRQSNLSN